MHGSSHTQFQSIPEGILGSLGVLLEDWLLTGLLANTSHLPQHYQNGPMAGSTMEMVKTPIFRPAVHQPHEPAQQSP